MVVAPEFLTSLNAEQLRELASDLIAQIANLGQTITSKDREILYRQAKPSQAKPSQAKPSQAKPRSSSSRMRWRFSNGGSSVAAAST